MTLLNPKWLESNFIKNVSEITAGGDDKIKQRLFDRNEELRYFSIGQTTGVREITWVPTKSFSVSRIFIQTCNFEDLEIEWFDASTSTINNLVPSVQDNSDKNLYFEFANIAVDVGDTIKFRVFQIFGGVTGEAIVGEIYIGAELFSLPSDRIGSTGLDLAPQVSQKLFALSDGTTQKIFVRKTVNYNLPLSNVSETDRVDFENLFERNRRDTFVFIPRPVIFGTGKWDGLGNHYNWANANDFLSFTANNFANGFDVNIVMLQAGGLD